MNNLYTINKEVCKIKQMRLDIDNNNDRVDEIDKKINCLVSNNFLNFDSLNDTLTEISSIKNSIIKINDDIVKINDEVKPQIAEYEQTYDYSDEVYIFLKKINYERYFSVFKTQGCEGLDDILLLSEIDFHIYEIPLVHTRKILKSAKYYIESRNSEVSL
jgi:hypothetical protein